MQEEVFMAQSLVTTAIASADQDIAFALYPNPVHEYLHIKIPAQAHQQCEINVHDVQGRLLLKKSMTLSNGTNIFSVDLPSSMIDGLYTLSIRTDHQIGHKKFFKM